MSIWDPGHQVELSGVKVQKKELKDQCGVVQLLQFIGNQETSRNMEISDSESDSPKGVLVQRRVSQFAESQQDEAALNEATAGLRHWLELRFSWRFQSLLTFFDLWWLCWAETLRVPWCFSKGMPCRAVHICAYCEAQGVEFQGVHASAERAHARPATSDCFFFPGTQQELLRKIQHSCCNDWFNLVSYDLIA